MNTKKINLIKNCLDQINEVLKECTLCPRKCKVNRLKGEKGFCRSGITPIIHRYGAHFGEEPPISGINGSGTIFFTNCTMGCLYCQNYPFSQEGKGREITAEHLSHIMLDIQKQRCHNINLVTPTHFLPAILEALLYALEDGLEIPVLYNTSGYETVETLKTLEGIVDIYLPDARYADEEVAQKYSKARDYPEYNMAAIKEMYRQVGNLQIENGIAKSGLIIRHLVLPNGLAGTESVMGFILTEISKDTYISLMGQYLPLNKASDYPEISRKITNEEYCEAVDVLASFGFVNGWFQEPKQTEDVFIGSHMQGNI